jgi:predicted GH43/DUF377 family glycosyl hydrolase
MVVREGGRYHMWFSGSDLKSNDHHKIGYAKSTDGISWDRLRDPVLVPPDPMGYYTTPAILRDARGELLKEDGKLRMWFTGKPFSPDLYMATSFDGIDWDMHSTEPIARDVYCPTVIYDEGVYRMWYTRATSEPFVIMHATSEDGIDWDLERKTVMTSTEPWEHKNMLYPFVLRRKEYEMYYTSFGYRICELALATSEDGISWSKGDAPILSPDPNSAWDSIYCSNASILPDPDGGDRMYYASRIDMEHKYYAIGLAVRGA